MSKDTSHSKESTAMKNEESTDSDTSTSKREHDENNSASEIVKKQKVEEENIINDESVPDLTNKLKHDDLLILFSWLSVDDLITVRRVCHSWRVAAQDNTLYRNHVLIVDDWPKSERKVKLLPHIRNIKGDAKITLLDVILENVDKLNTLNVEFSPPISPLQVKLVLDKYPEIQSIKLCTCSPNIFKCLEILKTSSHLRKVKFYAQCLDEEWNLCSSSPSYFMNIFTDNKNFPALTALNLSTDDHISHAVDYEASFRHILCNVITNRSQQLSSVKIYLYEPDSSGISNAISKCVNLRTLHTSIDNRQDINIHEMAQLRSLHLAFYKDDICSTSILQDSFNRGTWLHLTNIDITINTSCNVGLLKAIVDNSKMLKSLNYDDRGCHISDDQLENIDTLIKLEKLKITGIENITETSVSDMSKCYSLKLINIFALKSNINFYSNFFKDKLRQLINLQLINIRLKTDGFACFSLRSRQEIEWYIDSVHVP